MSRQWHLPGGPYLNADDTGRDWLVGGVQIAAAPAVTDQTITPGGIASGFAAGTPLVLLAQTVAPVGIPSGAALGAPSVTAPFTMTPAGIASAFAAGTPVVTLSLGAPPPVFTPPRMWEQRARLSLTVTGVWRP